jgi:hypothetical protein
MDLAPRTDASIPGVAPFEASASRPNFMAPPPPAKSATPLHVLLGLVSALAIGAIVVLVFVLSREKPEANAATPPPLDPVASATVAATTPPPLMPAAEASASASTNAGSNVGAPAKTAARTGPRTAPAPAPAPGPANTTKKGGPLVRSYD